jgi:singapore isolate B (sub-type 7) whole genome shotgun sequence assembly, scaffold_0
VGVGLVEGKNGVNWKLLYSVFAGWIFTILICAVATGALFYVSMLFIQFCGVC